MSTAAVIHEQWSSRLVFVLAATGSAVGLGNIWKFPYIAGEYGGGAFVLFYLACIVLVGLPVMIAEILLGRRGRQSPINTMRTLAAAQGLPRAWALVGWAGVVTGFLILSFYSVVAGWALAYVVEAFSGAFLQASPQQIGTLFTDLIGDPQRLMLYHSIFMLVTVLIVARGVKRGLEKAVMILMPLLLLLLLVLVGYAMVHGAFFEGLRFLFQPDFQALFYNCLPDGSCTFTAEPMLVALGHAFFTLSIGMGAIMVYGSYMPGKGSIAGASVMVVSADTIVALLAGLAIFPIVFANGLEPAVGPGLVFKTLPIAFGQLPGGVIIGGLFFVLLVFAAWSSSISLIEPAVAYLAENRGWSRMTAAFTIGALCWTLGLGTLLSFNRWSGEAFQLFGLTFFDLLDFLTANFLLPLGGLLIALFVGWACQKQFSKAELSMHLFGFNLWWWVIRFVTPLGILIIFLHAVGLF